MDVHREDFESKDDKSPVEKMQHISWIKNTLRKLHGKAPCHKSIFFIIVIILLSFYFPFLWVFESLPTHIGFYCSIVGSREWYISCSILATDMSYLIRMQFVQKFGRLQREGVRRFFSLGLYSKRGEKALRRVKSIFEITELQNCVESIHFSDIIFSQQSKNNLFENIGS